MTLFSQAINGALLPFVLIYMMKLVNNKRLMKEWTNSTLYNGITWLSVVLMIGLTVALIAISFKDLWS
jgi:Mn2+/Fe2+ NRAMP family transporter